MPGPRRDVKRDVKYLNKDFSGFRNDLIDQDKIYFPNSLFILKLFFFDAI